jgi:hypothetical protein
LNFSGLTGANQGQKSPGDAFAGFLEEGASHGVHLVAFCSNWKRLITLNRDMLLSFAYRIVYNLDATSAGEAADLDAKFLKGLDDENRAFYKDSLLQEQCFFLPYILNSV